MDYPELNETLFLLYSYRKNLKKVRACLRSWGRDVKNLLLVTDEKQPLPCEQEVIPSRGYENLCEKTLLMWNLVYKNHNSFRYFIKVDDDTLIFPKLLRAKLLHQSWEFFGNVRQYYKPNLDKKPWITGCFYGLSFSTLEVLFRTLQDRREKEKFLLRNSAEDVSISMALADQGIVSTHWDEILIATGPKGLLKSLFKKNLIAISPLKTWQMPLLYSLKK